MKSHDSRPLPVSADTSFKWTPYESPEGNIYFREDTKVFIYYHHPHRELTPFEQSILTFVDLYEPNNMEGMLQAAGELHEKAEAQAALIPEDTELVIWLRDANGCFQYGYYLASWSKRCVFWFDEVKYDVITEGSRVCTTETHIGMHYVLDFCSCSHVANREIHRVSLLVCY